MHENTATVDAMALMQINHYHGITATLDAIYSPEDVGELGAKCENLAVQGG